MSTIPYPLFLKLFRSPAIPPLHGHHFTRKDDLACILGLIHTLDCRRVVEIGVNDGRTAAAVLQACPVESYVGVDVAPDYLMSLPAQRHEIPQQPGRLVSDGRFRLVVRPTGSLELSAEDLGPADFVFIDGDHGRVAVEHDTRLARELTRGGGAIAWHDYPNIGLGVGATIDALNLVEGGHICWVRGTRVCFELRPPTSPR